MPRLAVQNRNHLATIARFAGLLLAILLITGELALSQPKRLSPAARKKARAARMIELAELDAAIEKLRAETTATIEDKLVDIDDCLTEENDQPFRQVQGAAIALGSAGLERPLKELIAALPEQREPKGLSAALLRKDFGRLKRELTKDLLKLATTAIRINAGSRQRSIATALNHLLEGNKDLAKLLGLRQHKGRWYDETELTYFKRGFIWELNLGWVKRKELERYANGSYFDLQPGKWTTVEEANQDHATLKDPWEIETSDYQLHGNAPLADLLSLRPKLQKHALWLTATLSPVLSRVKEKGKVPPHLKVARIRHKPFHIWFARTRAEYYQLLQCEPDGSEGTYVVHERRCIFPLEGFVESTALHESTHQILVELMQIDDQDDAGGRGLPAWFEEGLADYSSVENVDEYTWEALQIIRKSGPEAIEPHLSKLLRLCSVGQWEAEADGKTYWWSYMLVRFLFEYNGGEYEGDVMDLIVDSQSGNAKVMNYLGLTIPELAKQFSTWWLANAPEGE